MSIWVRCTLWRVLVNIIFNAMDALPQGGRIAVKTAQKDSHVVLSISDTGIGMTEEVKKRIFDPFFTTKGSRGSGLGLSASLGIISKHGGSIGVDSTLEKGSTFYIRLPIFNGTRRKAGED
jgi:signal transduction histidine kinase